MARVASVSPASLAPIGAWPEHVVGATWRWHPMLLRTQRELSEGLPGPRRPRAGSLTSQLTVCVGRRRASSWPGPPTPSPRPNFIYKMRKTVPTSKAVVKFKWINRMLRGEAGTW